MVANPDSGPGPAVDPSWVTAIGQAQQAGIHIIGYVYTDYGLRPLADVESDINEFVSWYGVDGIFLDEAASDVADLGYYQALYQYIHSLSAGFTVVLNPGVYPDQSYLSAADVINVFEGSYSSYKRLQVPAWAKSAPPNQLSYTVYAVPNSGALQNVLGTAITNRVGYVYVTDRTLPNPYGQLPSYWSKEVVDVRNTE